MDSTKYKRNQTIVKVFGTNDHKKIKVITLNSLRVSGIEDKQYFASPEDAALYEARLARIAESDEPSAELVESLYALAAWSDGVPVESSVASDGEPAEKMREAKCRARARIFDLAFCNEWQWFFTGTLDPEKYDRSNLEKFHKDLTQWLRDFARNRHIPKIDFLLIPELHADGKSWHMHGLINGLPADLLHRFQIGDIMGAKIAHKVQAGDVVYNWEAYARKFGFCDLEAVKDAEAVSLYCTKYITKSLLHSVKESGAHLYYHSRGLKTSEFVCVGSYGGGALPAPVYKNDYCSVIWLPYSEENIKMLREAMGREQNAD